MSALKWMAGVWICVLALPGWAAPAARLIPFWEAHNPQSREVIDHTAWDAWLRQYVVTTHADGIHRVRYRSVGTADRKRLDDYLASMSRVQVRQLNRDEQRAFWINLYNALTVQVVLRFYPVASIRDIHLSRGWFSRGPWQAKLIAVEGQRLSLDDIEHGILRPIWSDPRIHYAVNCASLGCPNLLASAFTAGNSERLLDAAATAYVNHVRGASVTGERLTVSTIYRWFQADFGGDARGVIEHLRRYAQGELAALLKSRAAIDGYAYDWSLNGE